MLKTVTNGTTNYRAEVAAHYPPVIKESYIDDEGILQYVLANGHQTPADRYNALWNPPKGEVKPKWESKGERIDGKQRLY